jgi:hypothetical protein
MQEQQPPAKRKKTSPNVQMTSFSGTQRSPLLFDESLLGAYNLHDPEENTNLIGILHMIYQTGSDSLRSGLHKMANEMYEKVKNHTRIAEKLQETQYNAETHTGILQTALSNEKKKYEELAEIVSEMETKASITEQLQHDINELKAQYRDLQTQLLGKQKRIDDLVSKEGMLQAACRNFRTPHERTPFQYPIMQSNGLIVDFYQVMLTWAKTGEEDDGYPYRPYICHISKDQTSLARISITAKIQEIASGLGMQLIPPMDFEFKNTEDTEWTKLGLMDQVSVIAKLCSMYTAKVSSSTIVVHGDQIYFNIFLDKVIFYSHRIFLKTPLNRCTQGKDGKFQLRCSAQEKNTPVDVPVRVTINRAGWNPFPNITQYTY